MLLPCKQHHTRLWMASEVPEHMQLHVDCAQDDAEKWRTCEMAAAEVQATLQGQRLPRGGMYVPPPKAAYNAMGPPMQVRCC